MEREGAHASAVVVPHSHLRYGAVCIEGHISPWPCDPLPPGPITAAPFT